MPTIKLEWEDPPERPTRFSSDEDVFPLLQQLTARPGQWAKLVSYPGQASAYGYAKSLKKRNKEGKLPGHYEFTVRRESYENGRGVGGSVIYGRAVKE